MIQPLRKNHAYENGIDEIDTRRLQIMPHFDFIFYNFIYFLSGRKKLPA